MKKRFWTRLISAVLTMAMAFSILAVPASAVSKESWAIGRSSSDEDEGIGWLTEDFFRDLAEEDDDIPNDKIDEFLEYVKKEAEEDEDSYFWEGSLPDNAYAGLSKSEKSTIYWYSKEMYELDAAHPSKDGVIDWDTGIITYRDGAIATPINNGSSGSGSSSGGSSAGNGSSGSESSSGGSSADGAGVAVVAVVGAAAAATGIYFYTHPEKIEEVKAFFADLTANVQAKVQEFTAGVKGAFGIVVPDQEDEEAAPVAETAAEEQAA